MNTKPRISMTIYGYALGTDGKIHGMADRRTFDGAKTATRSARVRNLKCEWLATNRGYKQAADWSARCNVESRMNRRHFTASRMAQVAGVQS